MGLYTRAVRIVTLLVVDLEGNTAMAPSVCITCCAWVSGVECYFSAKFESVYLPT